jgi:transcriptional regulator with XRE-family HTH domain
MKKQSKSNHFRDQKVLDQIGEKIKALREAKGWTQQYVFDEYGFNMSRIEGGRTNLTISSLKKLLKIFNTPLSSFFKDIE